MNDSLFLIFLFIFGTAIGSFIKVIADRLPNNEPITGRSHCDLCKKQIADSDLIPVLSYILLRGKCRFCHKKLSLLYPVIEIITGIMFVLTWNYVPAGDYLHRIIYLGIVSVLIVIFFSDLKYQIIPDSVQLALFVLCLIFIGDNITLRSFADAVIAALIVAAPILLLFLGTRGRGMGFGDVKLAFNIGLLLGLESGLIALYIAFISGAIFGAGLLLLGRKQLKSKIAFGPFLVIGIILMIFFKNQALDIVKRIYGL